MSQYHISQSGKAAYCSAKPGNCPLGGQHFRTKDEAEFYAQLHDPKTAAVVTAARDELSEMMDFGATIRTVKGQAHDVSAFTPTPYFEPNQYVDLNSNGTSSEPVAPKGWEYLKGFTGQAGYNGPIMHPSETVSGGLADHILSHPGYYASVEIDGMYAFTTDDGEDHEPVGWAVMHYIGGEAHTYSD